MSRKNKNKNTDYVPLDFVPYEKSSKKEKRRRDRERRNDWGALSPVTKVVPDKKKEKKREKHRRDNYYDEDWDY